MVAWLIAARASPPTPVTSLVLAPQPATIPSAATDVSSRYLRMPSPCWSLTRACKVGARPPTDQPDSANTGVFAAGDSHGTALRRQVVAGGLRGARRRRRHGLRATRSFCGRKSHHSRAAPGARHCRRLGGSGGSGGFAGGRGGAARRTVAVAR